MTAAVGLLSSLFHGKTEATDLLAIDLLSLLPSVHVQGPVLGPLYVPDKDPYKLCLPALLKDLLEIPKRTPWATYGPPQ